MEEKKLTDEELAKALLQSIEYSKTITYFDEWGNCKSIMITDILDLIYRLQDEKEELKKPKFGNWKVKFFKAQAEIERLTREVDKQKNFVTAWEESWKIANEQNTKIRVKLKKENAELQKQVDELEETANGCLLTSLYKKQANDHKRGLSVQRTYWKKKLQQAEKDTAKEILAKANELWLDTINPNCLISKIEEWIKDRYGVEVE